MSVVALGYNLTVSSYFTPSNYAALSTADADLSSGSVMLIPGTGYLTIASKDGRAWVLDTTALGGLQGVGVGPVQVFTVFSLTPSFATGTYGGLFLNGKGYFPIRRNPNFGFSFSGSSFTTTPFATSADSINPPLMMAGTSNAGATGIVWTIAGGSLSAYDASTLSLIYSGPNVSLTKLTYPVVSDGKVFAPSTANALYMYGLVIPAVQARGQATLKGSVVLR